LSCCEDIWEVFEGRLQAFLTLMLDGIVESALRPLYLLGKAHCIGGRVWRWRQRETFQARLEVLTVVLLRI
jgi:hypothetical protein